MRRSTTTTFTRVCRLVFKLASLEGRRLTFDLLFAREIYNDALLLVLEIVSSFGLIASRPATGRSCDIHCAKGSITSIGLFTANLNSANRASFVS